MRVLLVHNRYRSASPSGENRVVDRDAAWLADAGVEVVRYERDSDDISSMGPAARLGLAVRPIVSPSDWRAMDELITCRRPDVVHLHNPYPLVSPAVIRLAHRRGVPIVQTVHNYRYVCPAGTHLRDGSICEDCTGRRLATSAVRHGCYRDSRAQSAVMAGSLALHAGTWRSVDRLLPVSGFVAERLMQAGFAADRIVVHPNAVDDPGPPTPPGDHVLFLGRLEQAKGVGLLLDAWRRADLPVDARLVIAGDGADRPLVEAAVAADARIDYRGQVPATEARRLIEGARVVVVPSVWFEAMPLTVIEAFAAGRPVLATRVGALATLVDDTTGWRAAPTADALAVALGAALRTDPQARSLAARATYRRHHTPAARVAAAIDVYRDVVDNPV